MNKRKRFTYPIILTFMACLFTVLVASLYTVPKDYNTKEEKELAQAPKIYASESWDSFTTAWNAFVSDQFPLRDNIVAANQEAAIAEGEDVIIGDLYVLGDDYIFSHTPIIPEWKFERLATALADTQKKSGIKIVYNVVPQKNLAMADQEDKIDIGVDLQNLSNFTSYLEDAGILVADSYKNISGFSLEERSNFYFKTDYHWNELGAFKSSTFLSKYLASKHLIDKTSVPIDEDFIWTDYTGIKDYLGDLRKQISSEVNVEEYIPVYEPVNKDDFTYYTEINGYAVPRNQIVQVGIDNQVLEHNGMSTSNPRYLRVENIFAPEEKNVLVLRDSYACTMVDYLSTIFTSVTYVDPRYAAAPSLATILDSQDIDLILCVYHNSNMSDDLYAYLNAYLEK